MKKEHVFASGNNFENYLKSIGCIFYAPLTQGDLTDHISGASFIDPSGNAVQWDDSVQMYKFLKKEKSQEKYFPVNLLYDAQTNPTGLRQVSDQDYTLVCRCKRLSITTYGYPNYFTIGGYIDTTTVRPGVGSYREESDRESTRTRFLIIDKSLNYRLGYCDGGEVSVFYSAIISSNAPTHLLNNYPSSIFTRVAVNPKRDSGDPIDMHCYVGRIMIFNRALTNGELVLLDNDTI